ncbi:hypothetical protein [Bradyrhizobium sp. SBR1B]|uniref:hypothetical protein n=1 Tax=Bradyrhizobium sp. SBR1B TaxID=2663836 RepID=UPI0016059846|nr:hypothetical protein [Bradyrhizobium sp. SBR1B]MBB4376223.1 hypothetical protein [Bradyrhizobium sp. SBR1B]
MGLAALVGRAFDWKSNSRTMATPPWSATLMKHLLANARYWAVVKTAHFQAIGSCQRKKHQNLETHVESFETPCGRDETGIGSKETDVENHETDDVRYETSESTIIAQA